MSQADANTVLANFHSGKAAMLGKTHNGHIIIRDNTVTGYNHNPGAGYLDQETNVFIIKATSSPSIVPYNPNYGR